jgi:hypothetical protein
MKIQAPASKAIRRIAGFMFAIAFIILIKVLMQDNEKKAGEGQPAPITVGVI